MMCGRGIVLLTMVVMVVAVVVGHPCTNYNLKYLIRPPIFQLPTASRPSNTADDCNGNGAFAVGPNCYKLMEEESEWDNVHENCLSQGMVAAYPKPDIRHEVIQQIRKVLNVAFYVGAPDKPYDDNTCYGYEARRFDFITLNCDRQLRYLCHLRRKH